MMQAKKKVTVICYGQEEEWSSREEAMLFYLEGVTESDGSERDRYLTILGELIEGKEVCRDTLD